VDRTIPCADTVIVNQAEVAGVLLDEDRQEWRVSMVPIQGFATEQQAIDFYNANCEPEAGLPCIDGSSSGVRFTRRSSHLVMSEVEQFRNVAIVMGAMLIGGGLTAAILRVRYPTRRRDDDVRDIPRPGEAPQPPPGRPEVLRVPPVFPRRGLRNGGWFRGWRNGGWGRQGG